MRLDGDAASAVVGMTIVSKTRREAAKLYGLVLYHRGLLRALGVNKCFPAIPLALFFTGVLVAGWHSASSHTLTLLRDRK